MNGLWALLRDEQAAALTEYALIMALLALAMIGALQALSSSVIAGLQNVANQLTGAQSGP
jgi:Flp pilus assembly pilin Flp